MRSSRLRTVFTIVAVLAVLALILVTLAPIPALARAGGGEKFPGGGGGGGGYSGGGGGGGGGDGLGGLVIWLVLYSPIPWPLKIIIIIAILAGGGLMGKRRLSRGGRGITADDGYYDDTASFSSPAAYSAPAMPAPDLLAGLAELKARDPNFSDQAFEDMASTAFYKIQEAWSKKDMSIARAFTSPTLVQRFETQVTELKKAGRTNVIEDLTVGSIEIVEASSDGGNDYITVKIQAAAADYTIDDKTGNILFGAKQIKPFTEYWTFLRSKEVQTKAGEEIESKHCPNCGAPISLNAVGKCDYCGSDITSGKFSWVLAEISQASVWRPRVQAVRPHTVSPLAGGRYVLGLVQCPNCGANVQDILGVTEEKCWRCGSVVHTEK